MAAYGDEVRAACLCVGVVTVYKGCEIFVIPRLIVGSV